MKHLLLIFIVSSLPVILYGQNCNYSKNETDEFTKKSIKLTTLQTVANFKENHEIKGVAFSLYNYNGDKYLEVKYQKSFFYQPKSFCIKSGNTIMLKLDNDSIISLDYAEPEFKCADGKVLTDSEYSYEIVAFYDLNEEDIASLSAHKLTKIRLYTTEFYDEFEVSPILKSSLTSYQISGNKLADPQQYFINTINCIK